MPAHPGVFFIALTYETKRFFGMRSIRFCILGAGPSGLAFATALKAAGETSFVLLEKEATAGGLCRSMDVDGAPLDIGGGHFLDIRRQNVLDFLFDFMPKSEWAEHRRVSTIRLRNVEVEHPLEGNLWQLPLDAQVEFLESIAQAGCVRGAPKPEAFDEWIRWKLGALIAEEYMLPYNQKIWSMPLNELGTYWLHKLPDVSFRETLRGCLAHQSTGTLPAHGTFLYPKRHGYGEVWLRMAHSLGAHFIPRTPFESVDLQNRTVNGEFQYERLISSIPWTEWTSRTTPQMPVSVAQAIQQLVHTSIDVTYRPEALSSPAHWIYEPAENIRHHRLLLRHNFAPGSRGHWEETNARRSAPPDGFRHHNEYAYPVNTRTKPAALATILQWATAHDIHPLGRWGTWEQINSDVAVDLALQAARTYA